MKKQDTDGLATEFLEEISQRAEQKYDGQLHQAFIDWYVEAEFGNVTWQFTDDSSDAGIDAVIWLPNENPSVCILQSKFTKRVGAARLSRASYAEFEKVIECGYSRDVGSLLQHAREDVKRIYRKAFGALEPLRSWTHEQRAFRLITTNEGRSALESQRMSQSPYRYASDILRLYGHYRKTKIPRPPPLILRSDRVLKCKKRNGIQGAYVFNARVSDFHSYLESTDVARLVVRNIRFGLAGRVGREIRKTYEESPDDFWFLHNGLTIVCDDARKKPKGFELTNPSVVNGAQTLYAISGSPQKRTSATVMTRIIVRDQSVKESIDDDHWVQRVIKGVNTQNRVRADDFRSNEPEQVELQDRFREMKVFYERKRGEWKEYRNDPRFRKFRRLSLKTLGMLLTVVGDEAGRGVVKAKRGVEAVFGGDAYATIFPPKRLVIKRFKRMYLAYRIHRFVQEFAYVSSRERRKQGHAFWTTVWLLMRGIEERRALHSRTTVAGIKSAFDQMEDRSRAGAAGRAAARRVGKAVWSSWKTARRVDRDRWTANNFFKSDFGHRKVLQLARPRVRADISKLAGLLGAARQ